MNKEICYFMVENLPLVQKYISFTYFEYALPILTLRFHKHLYKFKYFTMYYSVIIKGEKDTEFSLQYKNAFIIAVEIKVL